jgi:hypothetical protein
VVIQSSKRPMSHIFKAKFDEATAVKLVQVYFGDQ